MTSRLTRRWIYVFTGTSVGSYLSWNILNGKTREKVSKEDPFWTHLYVQMPFNVLSRAWGNMHSMNLPTSLRKPLYSLYSNAFGVNLDEMDQELESYPNLGSFFYRGLKPGSRSFDKKADLVSPSDGKILSFGKVVNGKVDNVKGVSYTLDALVGPLESSSQLYYTLIYLAPGDYHRFHSPTHWTVDCVRHFAGELYSVSPMMVSSLKNLFVLNERVALIGKWKYGPFAFVPVGATNVGSIHINMLPELVTNQTSTVKPRGGSFVETTVKSSLQKGQEVGGFKLGSSIVMVFKAPSNFEFNVQVGQTIKAGEPLGHVVIKGWFW